MQPTLFQQALGAAFFRLPPSLRRLHGVRGHERFAGMACIERGSGLLSRLCAVLAGLPGAVAETPVTVEIVADAHAESWYRDFGGQRMTSRMVLRNGLLRERLGPIQFRHALHAGNDAIWWRVASARLFGLLPLPAALFSGVHCREREQDGRYEFMVEATLPLAGRIIRYEGWLEPVSPSPGE